MTMTLSLTYLSCTAFTADHQRLVHRLQPALQIPVGLLCHNKDMWFELLLTATLDILNVMPPLLY